MVIEIFTGTLLHYYHYSINIMKLYLAVAVMFMYCTVPLKVSAQSENILHKLDSLQRFDANAKVTVGSVINTLGSLPLTYSYVTPHDRLIGITLKYPYNEDNDIKITIYTPPDQYPPESNLGHAAWAYVDIEEVKALYFSKLSYSLIPKVTDRQIQMDILLHRMWKLVFTNMDSAMILKKEYEYLRNWGAPPKKR